MVGEQAHRQLVLLEDDRIRVGDLVLERLSEVVERSLTDRARVAEPPPVRLDAPGCRLVGLELGDLQDLTVAVADGLARLSGEEVDPLGRLGIAVKVLACRKTPNQLSRTV